MRKRNIAIICIVFALIVIVRLLGLSSELNENNTQTNKYEASSTIFVSLRLSSADVSQNDIIDVSDKLHSTLSEILKTRSFTDEITKEYPNIEYTVELNRIENTFEISVTCDDAELSVEICDFVTEKLQKKIVTIIDCHCEILDYAQLQTN